MLAEPVMVNRAGELEVPQTPGLGIELDEDAVARWRIG
jgi:L-alanine-DL-glutamate epimerase-like enolase superfamily enzyme